jgi:hypothetical protein
MSQGLLIRLRPTGPWRIGPDSGVRDRVDRVFHSDSLYSAVSSAMAQLGNLDEWLVTAHWIDTWHMGDKVMACRGTPGSNGEISVQGSYAVPPGPDWGWRTIIRPQENQSLQIIMFNIWPDGREELAVETDYTRV